MDSIPEKMDTKGEPSKLQVTLLGIDEQLPNDDEIKEAIQQINATNSGISSDDLSSDRDSEVEDMEIIWDAVVRSDEPYSNSIEHLTKLLEQLPTRYSTRPRTLLQRFDQRVLDKKELQQLDNIMKSRLVEPDIDKEILMENLERMRVRINNIIKKKKKAAQKLTNEAQGKN